MVIDFLDKLYYIKNSSKIRRKREINMNKKVIGGLIATATAFTIPSTTAFANSNSDSKFIIELNKPEIKIYESYNKDDFASANSLIREDLKKAKQDYEYRLIEQSIQDHLTQYELERIANVKFNPYDITQVSNITAEELKVVLNNTTSGSGLFPYASYFVEAEKEHGINALFLCALAAQESGWGRYKAGNGTNITGYAVYTSNHTGTTFSSVRKNVLDTAELISKHYTSQNGKYRTVLDGYNNGKSIYEVNQKYCFLQDRVTVDNSWAQKISKIAFDLEKIYKDNF